MWRRQMEKRFAIDDSALLGMLRAGIDEKHELTLLRSDRPMTDRHPLSIFSVQRRENSVRKLRDCRQATVPGKRLSGFNIVQRLCGR